MPQSVRIIIIIKWVVTILGLLIGYDLTLAFRDGWSNAATGTLATNNLLIYSRVTEYLYIICGVLLFWGGYEAARQLDILTTIRRRRLFFFWLAYLPLALFASIDIGLQANWPEAIFMLVLVMLTIAPLFSLLLTFMYRKTESTSLSRVKD